MLVPSVTPLPDDAEAADADESGEVLQQRGAGPRRMTRRTTSQDDTNSIQVEFLEAGIQLCMNQTRARRGGVDLEGLKRAWDHVCARDEHTCIPYTRRSDWGPRGAQVAG